MTLAGIIANPASGKDIRRLVAHGSVFDNQEKVRIVRRVLLGLEAMGVEQVWYMPDYYGIVERALTHVKVRIAVVPLQFVARGEQEDSIEAARLMEAQGVRCIVTLGGDGTNRVVAKGNGSIPILPVSTGTNNVFGSMIEGTTAGMAAGIVARGLVPLNECSFPTTKLEVVVDAQVADIALVDAAVYDDLFVASRAVWNMDKVRQIFLNRAEPHGLGLSSIGGLVHPVAPQEPRGLYLELGGNEEWVTAPVAPGIIKKVFIKTKKIMHLDEEKEVLYAPSLLALDGEREIEVRPRDRVSVRVAKDGPVVVDVKRTMAAAMKRGLFISGESEPVTISGRRPVLRSSK